jgi:predicted nucleic acid-binding Zn ribbon protein
MLDNGRQVPVYEYKRPDGTTFEIMQKMTDPPLAEDPDTGLPVTRVFHPIAVHFKGKGFYNTDYGTKKRAREKADHDSATKKSSEKSESKSDSGDSSGGGESKAVKKVETTKADSKPSTTSSSSKPTKD